MGAAFGSLLLWGAAALYKAVRGRDGMGMGDVKMMAMVGAFLGLRGTFLTILLGTFLGSVVGSAVILGLYASGWQRALAERASRRNLGPLNGLRWTLASQYQLPLGTFLGIAAFWWCISARRAIFGAQFLGCRGPRDCSESLDAGNPARWSHPNLRVAGDWVGVAARVRLRG